MFSKANKCPLYSTKKNHYIREDTKTKIIATDIRNTSETFIGIFMDIPLGYIIYYHHDHY